MLDASAFTQHASPEQEACHTELEGDGFERDLDVVAGRTGVGADLVGGFDEGVGFGLRDALHADGEIDLELEVPFVGGAKADGGVDGDVGGLGFLLGSDEVDRAAEARGVPAGEEVFRGRGAGLARAAHGFGNGEVDGDESVGGLGVSVAAAGGFTVGGEEDFDGHGVVLGFGVCG